MSDLLSSVIAAHGGLGRWRTVRAVDVTVDLRWDAGSQGLSRPSPAFGFGGRCDASDRLSRLGDESDERWIFTPNLVWIERRDGTIVEERSDPRGFCGACTRNALGSPAPDLFSRLRALALSNNALPLYSDGLRHARARGACRRSRDLARPRGDLSRRRALAYESAKANSATTSC